jgi:hypothetical protein
MMMYGTDYDCNGKIGRVDAGNSPEARAVLTLAGRTSLNQSQLQRWVSTYDRNHNHSISQAEQKSMRAAVAKTAQRQGPLEGPAYKMPTTFPVELAARKLMYGSDANYDGKLSASDGGDLVAAALALAGKKTLNQAQLGAWIKTYDGFDHQPKDGIIDEVEEHRVFWELEAMAEHLNPALSAPIADLAKMLIDHYDTNKDGKLSVADATGDTNHDTHVDQRDLPLQARALIRMTGTSATSADQKSIETMLKNFDIFNAKTREYGIGKSDGLIGRMEYPLIDESATWVAQSIVYEDQQADQAGAVLRGSIPH